uniref:Candidate secreted effector n=1 Tax=Meloidogyne incognita TaxID=6306 RepID=A0A914MJZ3_MELIC
MYIGNYCLYPPLNFFFTLYCPLPYWCHIVRLYVYTQIYYLLIPIPHCYSCVSRCCDFYANVYVCIMYMLR